MVFLFLGNANFAGAGEDNDTKAVEHLLRGLHSLHDAGVSIHKEYNFNDLNQLRSCVGKHGNLRDKAKGLRQQATSLRDYPNRVNLTLAADNAFTCVYCGGNGEDCAKILPFLEQVESNLATER